MTMKLPKYEKAVADKLKIVFHKDDADGEIAAAVTAVLNDLVAEERATRISSQAKGFRDRFRVPVSGKEAVIIEINPNKPQATDWRMTWEYNPSKVGKEGRAAAAILAKEVLGPGSQRMLANACIRKLHIAIDFEQHISDVAIEVAEKSASSAWGKTFNGDPMLQTMYFGAWASDHQLVAYDKEAEVLAAYAKKPDVTLQMVKNKAEKQRRRLRIEDRQSLTRNPVPLHRLADLREPFAGMHIFSYAEAEMEIENSLHRMVLELAKAVGLQAALKYLKKSERETMRKALARCRVDWWEPGTYLNAATTALKAGGLFPDFAFDLGERESSHAESLYAQRKGRSQQKSGFRVNEADDDEDDEEI